MKKIFTLILISLFTGPLIAQPGKRINNDHFDNRYYDERYRGAGFYYFSPAERNMEIMRINRFYNMQIQDVQHRLFLKRKHKRKMIRNLEDDRRSAIAMVNRRFFDRRNQFGDNNHYGKKYRKHRW